MFLGSIMSAVVGIPAIGYLISPAVKAQKSEGWIALGPLANYPVGVPTPYSFTTTKINGWEKTVNSSSVFVLRSADDKVKVLSSVCPHLSCRVTWHKDNNEYVCPCHDAHFSIDGAVTAGPPPRPMSQFDTKVESGNLFIHLIA